MPENREENARTESARRHDDSAIIDAATDAPAEGSRAGGNLARDIGTQASLERVRDPEAMEGVDAADDRAHGQDYPPNDGGAREG